MSEDLPVAVTLPSPLDTHVAVWIERDLGWQVVDEGGPLAPVIALSDRACGQLPWIAVTDGSPDGEQVRRHLTAGALDVVAWPHDRLRIPLLAARVERGSGGDHRGRLTVAGVAGGVGTSTVALAIGGLLAWSGAAVLVCGGADVLALAGAAAAEPALAGAAPGGAAPGGAVPGGAVPGGAVPADAARGWSTGAGRHERAAMANRSAPSPVPGVPRLSVVGDGIDVATAAWTGDFVVADAGTAMTAETTVVVSRPDRNLDRACASGRPVIVVGDQPLSIRDCRRRVGTSLLAHLPTSSRVARAGLQGHVPAALPGTWLKELRVALGRLERRS